MISLQEIVNNQKQATFYFGDDPITISYRPFSLGDGERKRFLSLTTEFVQKAHAPTGKNHREILKEWFEKLSAEWDVINDEGEVYPMLEAVNDESLPMVILYSVYFELTKQLRALPFNALTDKIKKK